MPERGAWLLLAAILTGPSATSAIDAQLTSPPRKGQGGRREAAGENRRKAPFVP